MLRIFDWRWLFRPDRSGDFPQSSGDRERGKFRPSEYPRSTVVAVAGDDGAPVGSVLRDDLTQLTEEVRKLRLALTLRGVAEDLGDLDGAPAAD